MLPVSLHLVWIAIGPTLGVALLLYTLPLVAELLVLSSAAAFPGRRRPRSPETDYRLAVIIPAHNEQHLIADCVRSVLAHATPHTTVYVIAHNCNDATAVVAQSAGATVLPLQDTVGGKGTALDFGFQQAVRLGAQGLLVIDADTFVGRNLLHEVAATLAAGAEALQCRYQVSNADATPRTRLAALAFLGMDVLRPLGRSRLGFSCGIFGNGFALTAETLRRVPYTANSLVEDLEYHLHLIRAGVHVHFLPHASVFAEMPETAAASVSQKTRWEVGRILMRRLWTGPLLADVLRGRIHMLEPLIDLVALPLATEVALLTLAFVFGVAAHLGWLTAYAVTGYFSILLYLMVAASLAPSPRRALRALAGAPGFLLWKLLLIPSTRKASRATGPWVRTKRNAESPNRP